MGLRVHPGTRQLHRPDAAACCPGAHTRLLCSRYTSSVKYDSEKHFIDDVYMPVGLSVSSCRQTVICVPNCTWRSYKAEVHLQPRNKPQRFTSTTIIYPKHAKTVYTTTLDYNCRKTVRRFLSSVELETAEYLGNDCVLDGC